jgi:hypothetical protein
MRLCFLPSLLGLGVACYGGHPEDETVGLRTAAIASGEPDDGHPAVGYLYQPGWGMCTGTLVGSKSVLTAAHCISAGAAGLYVVAGRTVSVAGAVSHREYREGTTLPGLPSAGNGWIENDVALVYLKQPAYGVAPIALANRTPGIGEPITLVGFGLAAADAKEWPPTKRRAENTVGNSGEKFILYGKIGGLKGGPGNICPGDSGGPTLVVEEGEERIAGVHSMGEQDLCGELGYDMAVPGYRAWIAAQAADNLGVQEWWDDGCSVGGWPPTKGAMPWALALAAAAAVRGIRRRGGTAALSRCRSSGRARRELSHGSPRERLSRSGSGARTRGSARG